MSYESILIILRTAERSLPLTLFFKLYLIIMLPAIKPFVQYNIDQGTFNPVSQNYLNIKAKMYLRRTMLHKDILNIIFRYLPFIKHNEIHRNCNICELILLKKLYDLYKINITFSQWLLLSKNLS